MNRLRCGISHTVLDWFAGQGLNQGMEDAYELAQYLKHGGLTADSLRQFEAFRIPKIRQIMAAELVRCCHTMT